MPTLLVRDGFRFFFFSNEGSEPPHVHVEHGDDEAKFWLQPVEAAYNYGLSARLLRHARLIVIEQRESFLERWHEYFGTD